ncbi:MAG: tetratricopeptide repeat protein [Haliea sp.]|nr:tetratricopeptide repeat protein [Haliea sp.]
MIWDFRMNYGNLLFARERYQQAEEQYRAVLASSCDHVETLNNLGVLCKGLGRLDEAAELLSRVTELRPEFIEARANLASVCLAQGQVEAAIAHFCEILIRDPAASRSRETLGVAYYLLGRIDEAADVYRAWLAEEPDNAIALHHMSACTGEAVPVRASDEYIRTKFDSFSASFDAKLAELEYRAPELVAQCVATRATGRGRYEAALDAGCGTGLCGPLLRPLVDELVGVDLSAGMLDRAREREVYDRLDEAELTLYLRANHSSFNLVVSADTLVYFGPLEEVFSAVSGALRRVVRSALPSKLCPNSIRRIFGCSLMGAMPMGRATSRWLSKTTDSSLSRLSPWCYAVRPISPWLGGLFAYNLD